MKIQQHFFDIQIGEYDSQIQSTDKVLRDLAKLLEEANMKNKSLQEENDILRKSSQDCIAIAVHVQEMTKEKEKLAE
jgi:regulator of replication initiation timing